METISIDIETYSGNDLNKCGVYKYVQHPDFVWEEFWMDQEINDRGSCLT